MTKIFVLILLILLNRMEEEMVNKFSKFWLKEKEERGIVIDGKDIEWSKDECERSLIGKVWGSKTANFTGMRNTLTKL